MDAPQVKTEAEKLTRVYVDISFVYANQIKLRIAQMSMKAGRHVGRKEYLESLIEKDLAQVSGASLREVRKFRA